MSTSRLEALSDGVIAIIITIMVLQFDLPEEPSLSGVATVLPTFASYAISFCFVGIYWHNHHNLIAAVEEVTTTEIWLNLHFLFWLSLLPFVTAWMDKHLFSNIPVALYGAVLALCSAAYVLLRYWLARTNAQTMQSEMSAAKSRVLIVSTGLQCLGIGIAFIAPLLATGLYLLSLGPWIFPERHLPAQL